MTPSQYLIEFRNPDGNLLLPQYGGCWHQPDISMGERYDYDICRHCGLDNTSGDGIGVESCNPNLTTPQGFFDLKRAMEAREDYQKFYDYCFREWSYVHKSMLFLTWFLDEARLPETVASYLKGLER